MQPDQFSVKLLGWVPVKSWLSPLINNCDGSNTNICLGIFFGNSEPLIPTINELWFIIMGHFVVILNHQWTIDRIWLFMANNSHLWFRMTTKLPLFINDCCWWTIISHYALIITTINVCCWPLLWTLMNHINHKLWTMISYVTAPILIICIDPIFHIWVLLHCIWLNMYIEMLLYLHTHT